MIRVNCCEVILTVLLSPLGHFCVKGKCNAEFCINLILAIVGFLLVGVIHAFYTYGLDCCTSILCLLLPPIGVLIGSSHGCSKALICLLLCLLGWFPGVVYAYYVCLNDPGRGI